MEKSIIQIQKLQKMVLTTKPYIDSFLEDVHYTRYIDGELEGVQSINVGGYDIQPIAF